MQEYRIEFDVKLWDYVLHIDGKTIPLNQQSIREAHWCARVHIEGRKCRDSSTGNHNPTHN
jgi:hypothetical protein